jgi:RNA polymerase-binding transcription factor DksA
MSTRLEAAPAAVPHVSPVQLAGLRDLLVEEHAVQQARAVELQEPADLESDLAEFLLVRCREALAEIEEALRLIDQGGYGRCFVCGAAVPYERLEAVPATRRCVSCQARRQEKLR